MIQLVVLLQLVGFCVQAQEIVLPEDFYDPQLLALSEWSVYTKATEQAPITEAESTSAWVALEKPQDWYLSAHQTRWYRAKFTIGWHYRSRNIGLFLGSISQAHEIYLNGKKIGGEGTFVPNGIDAAGKPSLTRLPQLGMWYSFMNLSRENYLIVGVQGFTEPIHFNPKNVLIDDMDRLALKARDLEVSIKVIQGAAISILLLITLFCGFLFVSGFREHSNMIFGSFVLMSAVLIFIESLLFYDFNLRFSFIERLAVFGKYACTVLLCHLLRAEVAGRFKTQFTRVDVILGITILLGVFFSVPLRVLDLIVDIAVIGLISHTVWISWRSFKLVNFEIKLMSNLFVIVLLANLYNLFFTSPNVYLNLVHICYVIAAFTFLYLIARRYQDMSRHLSALSERLVTVRDLERARMARDMHDGLGQGIVAVGLHLKILASGSTKVDFGNLTQSIDDLNVHLGEVIQSFRPSILKRQTLGAAIERHIEQTLTSTDLKYDCAVNKKIEMPFEFKEQLFRVYQEALNNAIKHAKCTIISVEMTCIGRKLKLVILDDGVGFEVRDKRDLGLGLSTMRERASLVNAAYILDSVISSGTKVQIEVELDD
jgi:signal transduction histidine kinase